MKKNTMQVIIIVLLIILIAMVFGFGVYYIADEKVNDGPEISDNDTNITENNGSIEEDKVVEQNLSIDSELVQDLWKTSGQNHTYVTGDIMIDTLYKNDNTLIANLSDYMKSYLVILNLSYDCDNDCYAADNVNKAFHRVFGDDVTNILKNKSFDAYVYQSDGSLDVAPNDGPGAGPGPIGFIGELVDAKKIGNDIVLYQSCKFTKLNSQEDLDYYSDYNKTIVTTEDAKDTNYKLIFKQDSKGNYYFYSVEKVK